MNLLQLPQNPYGDIASSPIAWSNSSPVSATTPRPGGNDKAVNFTEKVQKIVESNERTDYEGRLLFEEIKQFQFFETFNERNSNNFFEKNAFIHLCKKLKYEKIPAKKVIFKQNDASNGKLYLLYSGEVSVVIRDSEAMASLPQLKTSASLKTESISLKDNRFETPINKLRKGDSLIVPGQEENDVRNNKYIPTITLNQATKSKFALPEDYKGRDARAEKNSIIVGKEDSVIGTPKGVHKKNKESLNFPQLSGFHDSTLKEGIEATEGSNRINTRRRVAKNLKNSQPDQDLSLSVDETIKSLEQKARSKVLKAKLKAVTQVTLGAIKFGKIVSKNNQKISEEDEEALMDLGDLIKKYGNLENKLEKGAFFGERALFLNNPRAATIITNTDCEFLVMNKRDFHFVSDNFDSKRKQTIKFMMDYIPDIENINAYEAVERILYVLQEKTYERGNFITNEGENGDYVHILCDGSCDIFKSVKIEEPITVADKDNLAILKRFGKSHSVQEQQIAVCKIQKGVFIGEEILYDNRTKYNFSIKVTSAFAKVYSIHKVNFFGKFSITVQTEVQRIYNSKMIKYASIIRDVLATKYPDMSVVLNNFRNKDLGLFVVYDKLVLRPRGPHEVLDFQSKEEVFRRSEKRAATFKGTRAIGGAASDREGSPYQQTPEITRQKTDNPEDLKQMKFAISPFMRSMVVQNNVPRASLLSGMKAFTQGDEEDQKDVQDSIKIADILNQEFRYESRINSPCQTEYICSTKRSGRSLAPLTKGGKSLGLKINVKREINDNFGQGTSNPSSALTERSKRLLSLDPPARLNTFDSDDQQEDDRKSAKNSRLKDQLGSPQQGRLGNSGSRIDSLFKRSQRKLNKKFFTIDKSFACTSTGQAKMSPQVEYCQLSSEDLYLTNSSLPKTDKARPEDHDYWGKSDLLLKNPFGSKGSVCKGQSQLSKNKSAAMAEENQFVLTASSYMDASKDETAVKDKNDKSKSKQDSDKEESHSARLKRKHQIRLQLRSKRDRDSLNLPTNTSHGKGENKINSARGGNEQNFRYF